MEPIVYSALAEVIGSLLESENISEQIVRENKKEIQRRERSLGMEQTKLEKIRHDLCVMEDKIPEAINGTYPLSLEDLVHNINRHKEREQAQRIVIQQKEADLHSAAVAAQNQEDEKRNIPTWQELFFHADTPTKRVLVNTLIEHIDITRERVVVRFRASPDRIGAESRITDDTGVPK